MRGYDDMDIADRRKLCRSLIGNASKVTPEEEGELSVLLLMGTGLNERQARADVRLRKRQVESMRGA